VTPSLSPRARAPVLSLCAERARRLGADVTKRAAASDTGTDAASATPEPWVTKRRLAKHLDVTPRWIEMQQRLGLPRLSTGGMNRYRISEVEAWLRERYGSDTRKAA
jgi:hypothetical protein